MTFKKTILIILAGLLVLIAGLAITITLLMPPGKTPVPGKQWPALSLAPDLPEALRGADVGMLLAPKNTELADGVNALPHGDPSQQDATAINGPMDVTRRLKPNEIVYQFLGPGYFGAYTSSLYPDGRRVIWANGVNGIYKLDSETYEILAHMPSDKFEKYNEAWAEKITASLDRDNSVWNLPTAMRAVSPLMDISGVYCVVGKNGWIYIANKDGSIRAYGDAVEGDAASEIVEKAIFRLPENAAGPTVGMNMTYDGWIVYPTENGYLVAISSDLTQYHMTQLTYADEENTESLGVGYGWVRNSIALDDEGGIYVVSRNHMHKVIWTGDGFSKELKDGAWVAEYRSGKGGGSGATPALMGFGDEDRLIALTDGDELMNVTLMWRDDIPEDWEQLPGAPSRRIAGLAPVTMGPLKLEKIQTEQTVIVAGYGVLVVNNQPRNVPSFMPKDGGVNGLFIGPLGGNPDIQPYGVQKFQWDPETRRLYSAWVNAEVSSPNGVPWVSLGTRQVYFIGARNKEWTLEALNWDTGDETFHYIIGGQKFNSEFSGPTIDEKGRIFYGTMWGRALLKPIKADKNFNTQ